MAYLRYSRTCDWYVFEQPDGSLAVWHQDHRRSGPSFMEAEVRAMLASNDFTRVPGFQASHRGQLVQAFQEWLADLGTAAR